MDKSIQGYLGSLQLGEVQQFKNLAMVCSRPPRPLRLSPAPR